MKKVYGVALLCAAILAGNYAVMRLAGNAILSAGPAPSAEPGTSVLSVHEPPEGEASPQVPAIAEGEREAFEEIAGRMRFSADHAAVTNRPMRESENSRRWALQRAYTRGVRLPEKPLPLQKTDGSVWFDPEALAYQYPGDDMSDEMLLELIEFDAKINLLLAGLAEDGAPAPRPGDLTEEQAVDRAGQAVFDFYGADAAFYDAYASLLEADGGRVWSVSFFPPNEDLLSDTEKYYQVLAAEIDADTNELLSLDRTENRAHTEDAPRGRLTREEAASCEDAARQALSRLPEIPEGLSLAGVYASTQYSDIVFVVLSDESGSAWRVALCWPEREANGFSLFASREEAAKDLTPFDIR